MKEDILEQIVESYFQYQGYFTQSNVGFRPDRHSKDYSAKEDSNYSDIDILGFNPKKRKANKVVVVSCKAWQAGFDPAKKHGEIKDNKTVSGRPAWKGFRELCREKWGKALCEKVENATGSRKFTYHLVVTSLLNEGGRETWEEDKQFLANIEGNPIKILTLTEMMNDLWKNLGTTQASTEIGRTIQLIKASKWKIPQKNKGKKSG